MGAMLHEQQAVPGDGVPRDGGLPQRLIVEVCQGRLKGLKKVIAPGESLRVGRTDRADLVLPKDAKLSGLHFELSWDGEACRLRDINSKAGTLLSGEAVTAAEVPHGSWIRAGQTDFSIYYEGHTPPLLVDTDDDDYQPEKPERVRLRWQALTMLQAEAEQAQLYAVLDAARDKRILEVVRESVEDYQSLYEGVQGEKLAHAAPYLVHLPSGSRLLDQLVAEGWGKRWGLYLSSSRRFKEVRRHLRRFLMVELEEPPSRVYFRYYDPYVMDAFWASSTVRQREKMMAELRAIIFETRRDGVPQRVGVG